MSLFKKLFSSKQDEFQQPEILLEEQSPLCPITAIVEQDNRVAYFYLWGPENSSFGVKSCWIRNLQPAPNELDPKEMEKGVPPRLPKEFCQFPEGQEKLSKKDLSIIWTEEGDSAALLVKGEIVAIIPIWGGQGGFFGYAKHCIGQGNFAWELTDSNAYLERIEESVSFLESWDHEINPFQIMQPLMLEIYDELFGKNDQYFAIDGNDWLPRGLYLRNGDSKTIFATVGLSLVPMPMVELYHKNRFDANRIELGLMLNSDFSESALQEIAEWISGQAALPWENITFLGEGHTINFKAFNGTKFTSVVLTSKLDRLPLPDLGEFRNSKINFLWMVPISDKERTEIMENGSAGILGKLNTIGEGIFSLQRDEVI